MLTQYPLVHNVAKLALQLGKGVLMAKIDKMLIESFQSTLTTEDCWELDGMVKYMSKQHFHLACVQPPKSSMFLQTA